MAGVAAESEPETAVLNLKVCLGIRHFGRETGLFLRKAF
jgi:hypothetical protein